MTTSFRVSENLSNSWFCNDFQKRMHVLINFCASSPYFNKRVLVVNEANFVNVYIQFITFHYLVVQMPHWTEYFFMKIIPLDDVYGVHKNV